MEHLEQAIQQIEALLRKLEADYNAAVAPAAPPALLATGEEAHLITALSCAIPRRPRTVRAAFLFAQTHWLHC